ncbi:glutamate-5-semialdehyde dehydrogenase [Sphingorhabdus lutea]|uniref:Gamma-glutamyl phosphate reductase n=1 Tax=Sphingorhabdus lutea TaxID=1913578 RepID=A0A1L3JD78_9SPHN|nr:glutamate-5-semialdehyde dehydrogenase [Sphingorhabdus lutea]APG63085.1 glutamate-5-semialdehyde dehydrogenase [Sphingorhabdus lutea]
MIDILTKNAKTASKQLALMSTQDKARALLTIAAALGDKKSDILLANEKDVESGRASGLSGAMLDRLMLDDARIEGMINAVIHISKLDDPVGQLIDEATQPNGLVMQRRRIPIGVIGIIYESRPNVTTDAAALCLMSGNAVILRGGSEAVHSNRAIFAAIDGALNDAGFAPNMVQLMPSQDRKYVGDMLAAQGGIDLIIPRGGKSLVARVQDQAKVPVLAHLDGICHQFVHQDADRQMALDIVVNSKLRRTGICGAMETLLIDQDYPYASELLNALADKGCELRLDDALLELEPRGVGATDEDWDSEYLDAILSARLVRGIDGAMEHISRHSSGHTDAIITNDKDAADKFVAGVDSAIVMVNASTQFADGGEFGLGAEIGIATGRLHARGPVALEGLTTYKWVVQGSGQVRP